LNVATATSESSSSNDLTAARARAAVTNRPFRAPIARREREAEPSIAVHVMNERLFKSVIHREHRRTDRADQSFIVALIDAEGELSTAVWDDIIDGLAAAKRDTDYLGWYRTNETLGLILTDVGIPPEELALAVDARVQRALSRRVRLDVFARLTITFHVHPDSAPLTRDESLTYAVSPLPAPPRTPTRSEMLYAGLKRAIDIVGSASLLLVMAPFLLLVGALVKLMSPGPVFFRQVRVGQMKKPFTIFKFRTMNVNADSAVHQQFYSEFIKSSKAQKINGGDDTTPFKIANDSRITPIGALLRKTSVDELPQLLNVLRGEMSLVGPRPPLPYELEQYERWHCRRVMDAKPGLTGLWQVAGRSRTTFDEMVRLDLRYAKTRSLATDLKILLATPGAVIAGKGAC
jgi:lipopolysaccharide/colanic/teichoic acid biosynthesis glycosyltransferase